ncbi:non-specific serine/threonine protein kinase [Malassezia cuniculi]|uniref:non-specific serine/threonine protein kinase n=1 Tax=Malassezia cuniculi TaxID=948313 RepID=A0AAF0J823_9BASI|nr:non-specific serine/threonine protein kinase [Malassezia cuniculi]
MQTLARLNGFVKLQGLYIVQGKYPTQLLDAWDAFREEYPRRNENSRPDYRETQLYALLLMDHGGEELEDASLSWIEAAGVFWQVAHAIAAAEDFGFEHRDLHMGNILFTRCARKAAGGSLMERYGTCTGVQATVIDYSLSRLSAEPTLAYMFDDKSLFEGQGDSQYDVYRSMKALVADDWSGFYPITNILWLQYILQQLLARDAPDDDDDQIKAYETLLLAEQLVDESVEAHKRTAPKRRVSTRSKRRSIQHSPDRWRAPHSLAPIRSVTELVERAANF